MVAMVIVSLEGAHTQRPESSVHVVSKDAEGVGAALAIGGSGGHDCQEEHEECMERCWGRRYPRPHNGKQSGRYYEK